MTKNKGLPVKCDNNNCGYNWNYKGTSTKNGQYVTCPKCKKSVKINTAKKHKV